MFSSTEVMASNMLSGNDNNVSSLIESASLNLIPVLDIVFDNKCGGIEKEAKKETRKEGTAKAAKTSEGKSGGGKCGME